MARLLLPLATVCAAALVLLSPNGVATGKDKKDPDGDTSSLLPSSIKDYEIEIDLGGTKLPVRVQYAVQGQTIFVLPVWVAGGVERVVDGKVVPCKPDERLLPADAKGPVQLRVGVRNLLESPEIEKVIEDKLRQRVLAQQGLDANAKFRIERPNINADGIRFNLIGPGRGDDTSPAEIAVANPVSRAADDKLNFTIDPAAVRKIETDRSLPAGLTVAALTVLPTGPMKVRFERLELDAQVKYLRATIDDFRKRVGSAVDSPGASPDVIVSLGGTGAAETRNQLRSMLVQSLQVTVSTRQGVAEQPLMPFLEKAVDSMMKSSELDMKNDHQRVTFLMNNQVTLSATLGEIKRLSKLDEKSRTEAVQKATDHYHATRTGKTSAYVGNLHVGLVSLGGGHTKGTTEQDENRVKEQTQNQKAAFDKVLQEFDGKVPTLSGIRVDDETLASSSKQIETQFKQSSFFIDYTLHRFSPVKLSGSLSADVALADLVRDYALLKADYENLRKLVGTPTQLAEAKTNMEKLVKLNDELKAKLEAADKTATAQAKAHAAGLAKLNEELRAKLTEAENALGKLNQAEVQKLAAQVAELKRRAALRPFEGHDGPVNCVAFSPDGAWMVTGGDDKTARIWVTATGKEFYKLEGHTGPVRSVTFSPDGKLVLTSSDDQTARVWQVFIEMMPVKELLQLKNHTKQVCSAAFSADGKYIVTGSDDNTARIWDGGTGVEICKLEGHTGPVRSVAFSPDGTRVLTGSDDQTARIWEGSSGKELFKFDGHTGPVRAVAFSTDGKQIVTGSSDNTVRLSNATTGKGIRKFEGHTGSVNGVAFSTDGKWIVTGSDDRTARVWETGTGKEVRKFEGHTRRINGVGFSSNGKRVVTGSRDGIALVWDIE